MVERGAAAMNEQEVVSTYWRRHRQWSTLASQLKARIAFWRTTTLVLACAGALLQTLSTVLGAGVLGTAVSATGALALVFVPFITKYFLTTDQVRQWLRARSMSEGLKSLIYRFQARAAPFADGERAARLAEAGKLAEGWVESLAVELSSVDDGGAPPPGALDPDAYIQERVSRQIDTYYRRNARTNAARALRYRRLEIAAAAVAAGLGAVATAFKIAPAAGGPSGLGAWVAVLTTIGGAIAAHATASRYDQQARMYFATTRQLEDLLNEWTAQGRPRDAARWSAFVDACEDAISAENRGWMAKLDPEENHA